MSVIIGILIKNYFPCRRKECTPTSILETPWLRKEWQTYYFNKNK